MKNVFYFLVAIITILMSSCTPDNPATPSNGAVTVKYEIILSSPLIPISPTIIQPVQIIYKNGTAQDEYAYNFNYGSQSWTKTVNWTAIRPYQTVLASAQGLCMNTAGTITANIYINGVVKATQTIPTQNYSNGINCGSVSMFYVIQ